MILIDLTEYSPKRIPRRDLSIENGEIIWRIYGQQIDVEFPTPKTNNEWELKSKGWVGHIPIGHDIVISIKPKVELKNLFLMLEYAYRLKSLKFLYGLMSCESLSGFYQHLARILSRRVMDRGRRGFYHAYIDNSEPISYLRGRLEAERLIRAPWQVKLWCLYQNHTPDIVENQIIAWTLRCIARSGICADDVLSEVRRAYRGLQNIVQLTSFSAKDCIGRLYNRLNDDYESLHALCRFFLEHSGPALGAGAHSSLPFLVDMSKLYEVFVAEWLSLHLPPGYHMHSQENVSIGTQDALNFSIDIVIYDAITGRSLCVLDTKYKAPETPSSEDFAQVVTYAKLKGCRNAILVYPLYLKHPIDILLDDVRVRSLTFDLKGDLEKAGQEFCDSLLG